MKRPLHQEVKPKFVFDKAAADRACEFFPRYLRHIKGPKAGKPLELETWQREQIVRPLFGWKREDGTRRYRTAYIFIPREIDAGGGPRPLHPLR
jgi:phage terminase large subunit-like protein